MIPVEGKALAGLDEFMLRLGHLKLVCSLIAINDGGSWRRVSEDAARWLKAPVRVGFDSNSAIAEYLFRKGLCRTSSEVGKPTQGKREVRYPDILVHQAGHGHFAFLDFDGASESTIWWQDACLAHPEIRSPVGAITTDARSGSKTGLSHIYDWAVSLELIAKNGKMLPLGRLISDPIAYRQTAGIVDVNPYLIGGERIVLAYAYLNQDIDVCARLLRRILSSNQPITPAHGGKLFVEALEEVVDDGERSSGISIGGQHKLNQQLRDLERAAKRARKDIGRTSTAWHRAASRFETYVDLGLLDKIRQRGDERFKYHYYANERTEAAVITLNESGSAQEWIDTHLAAIVLNVASTSDEIDEQLLLSSLIKIVERLALPTRLLPIEAVALALVRDSLDVGIQISLATARNELTRLARSKPELARLSRGSRGDDPQYISINPSTLRA